MLYEIRCPSCRLRLWLHQGMGRDIPLPHECPGCHVSHPIKRSDAATARIASDHHAERAEMRPINATATD